MILSRILPLAALASLCTAFPLSRLRTRPNSALNAAITANRRRGGNNKNTLVMMPSQVPQVPWQPPGQDYSQWVDIYSRLYRERILYLRNFIDEEEANSIICTLLYLRKEDPNKKISLYINVPGALLRPALAVYDTICQSRNECEISTLNLGLATGMGAMLCGAGTRGQRSSMPNARFLLQRVGIEKPFQGQASDIGLEVKNVKENNDRIEKELAKITGQTVAKIHNDMMRDFYLSSEEAVAYGLIDNVLLPPTKGFARVTVERDPWTGEKIVTKEPEVNLGVFGGEEQRFDNSAGAGSGGWGTGWKLGEDDNKEDGGVNGPRKRDDDDDDYEPPTQK